MPLPVADDPNKKATNSSKQGGPGEGVETQLLSFVNEVALSDSRDEADNENSSSDKENDAHQQQDPSILHPLARLNKIRQKGIMKWLLALFVFCTLSWVCVWTCLAAHTDVARFTIYPALESTYFEGKEGAKVFTYLGVFYILAGAVSLTFLAAGVRLPKPTPAMVRSFRLPGNSSYWTVLDMCAIFIFLAVQIATFVTRLVLKSSPTWEKDKMWYEVTKTLGKTLALTLMVLFLPISKSCFWWDLFNLKFERAVKFHRFLAWFWALIVVVHAATAVTSLTMAGQFKNCMWPSENCEKPGGWGTYESLITSRTITYGWTAALVSIPLVITSLPWFRRHKFELFYYTHFLFIPALILMHLHYRDLIYFTAPGLAAYVLDKVLWWLSSRRPTKLISLTTPAPGFVRMVIAIEPGHTFEPGQWVQLKVPAVSMLQWHPMSVASASGHSTIAIDIKVLGDWTRSLQDMATRFDPSRCAHTCVFLDRFHGSSHTQMQGYLNHSAVLVFAGGIGITPMMSFLCKLVEDSERSFPNVRRVVMVWVVKKESVVNLYRQELARYQSLGKTASGCELDVIVHATLSEKEDENESVSVDMDSQRTTSTDKTPPSCRQSPFMQHLMGYGHKLALTVGAGGGYLLGLFLANFFAFDKEWRSEYQTLLQLTLAVLSSGAIVATGMSGPFFRPSPPWSSGNGTKRHDSDETTETMSSLGESLISRNEGTSQHLEERSSMGCQELDVVLGCRPDLEGIVSDMKNWCFAHDFSSVGVAVCGPDRLTQTVMKTCRKASSSSLHFVVDDETFEW